MFEPGAKPRVFGAAPGVDFPAALIDGLRQRLQGQPPHAMAQVDLIVNTNRMERRLKALFDSGPPGFLPRIHLLTRLENLAPQLAPPQSISPLRRRLELVQLVSSLLDADERLAPRASLYGLADSLAGLVDEMQGEGVSAADIAALDVSQTSRHWENIQRFLGIAHQYLTQTGTELDAEARQRLLVSRLADHWRENPPAHPVILAGSTGSRGTTAMLMHAIARLPQGAIVLPGFDFDMPTSVWNSLLSNQPPEDHPQYRFFDLMQKLELSRADITPWTSSPAPSPARNALISLSLRPAPVTDTWLSEGPLLTDLDKATEGLTLIEAPSPRIEGLTIAMGLRKAISQGLKAALITPDRMLTRRVTAALDRWNILPDDSAGMPLQLSPPGRFLRHVAMLMARPLDAEALLTLLKHPLTHSGTGRNDHLLHTQRLEARIRRDGLPYPDPVGLDRIAAKVAKGLKEPGAFLLWIKWVAETFCQQRVTNPLPLTDWVPLLRNTAEGIAGGTVQDADNELWKKASGQSALAVIGELVAQAEHGGTMAAADFADLLGTLLSTGEVRDRDAPHPQVMIWGTLEARVQGADLVILGGLNEGSWPEAPPPDPWLNRQMRLQAGLLLPERRIGLSAHDYQQAVAAQEVWITRAIRSDDAETVPSRWVSRLTNLMSGLTGGTGAKLLEKMRQRGDGWLAQAKALEAFDRVDPAPRPSPRPPVGARPHKLSVTEIQRLIRDPYAIYARHTLKLRSVNPLVQSPDAPVRGVILHKIMEDFVKDLQEDPTLLTRDHLLHVTETVLAREAPWPAARLMWQARIARVADWFIEAETARRGYSKPALFEEDAVGKHEFTDIGFTLTGKADRIDLDQFDGALIYDYKTGTPPTPNEQKHFDKQLLLEAAMIEAGGFARIGPASVSHAAFIGLGSTPKEVAAPLDEEPLAAVLTGLHELVSAYLYASQGFTARRLVKKDAFEGEFDQLARFGEWDGTTKATPEDLS